MNSDAGLQRILYITPYMPCPARQGAQVRTFNIAKQLEHLGKISVLYVGPKPSEEAVRETQKEFEDLRIFITRKPQVPLVFDKFVHKFLLHFPWYHGTVVSNEDRKRFLKMSGEHDIVWFHTFAAADAFGQYRFEHSVLDIDDIASIKYKFMLHGASTLRLRLGARCLMYKAGLMEKKIFERFSVATVCSDIDKRFLGEGERIFVVPNGHEMPAVKPCRHKRDALRIGFIGYLDYTPNSQGLDWFGKNVWPLILRQYPGAKLRIIGTVPTDDSFLRYHGFEPLGFVEKTDDEFATWSAMVVPLLYGGGTRLKILDAFSKMCPVVSTTIGAYGLNVTNESNILLADKPEQFANTCIRLIQNESIGRQISQNAWELFENHYTWEKIGLNIQSAARAVMKSRN